MNIKASQRGLTLVELLVGMVVGLFIVGATGSMYLASRSSYRTADAIARMQENGRIALYVISEDLQLAGFLGNTLNINRIAGRFGTPEFPVLASNDCAAGWYLNLNSVLQVGNDQELFPSTCMSGRHYVASTDVISIKRASQTAADPDDANNKDWTLIRSDLSHAQFYIGGTTIPTAGFDTTPAGELALTDRRWLAHVYFVRAAANERPQSLRRLRLGSGPTVSLDPFEIPGVQDLQIQFGIDTNGDGAADSFVDPDTPDAANVVAARVWILMLSETPEFDLDDSVNTYVYAGRSYTPGDGAEHEPANPKNYRRLLLSTTVELRNARRQL